MRSRSDELKRRIYEYVNEGKEKDRTLRFLRLEVNSDTTSPPFTVISWK